VAPRNPKEKLPELVAVREWIQWYGLLTDELDKSAKREASANYSAQTASLATTPFALGAVPPGLYRATFTARITTPGSTSSSLEVTFSWTDGGVAQSVTSSALTGNLTTSVDSGVQILRSDDGTPINYATTYASAGGTPMQYALGVVLEALALD
jgi:hypothetical protein